MKIIPAKRHNDCAYCGCGGDGFHICGVCKKVGIDGPVIRGTSERRMTGKPRRKLVARRRISEMRRRRYREKLLRYGKPVGETPRPVERSVGNWSDDAANVREYVRELRAAGIRARTTSSPYVGHRTLVVAAADLQRAKLVLRGMGPEGGYIAQNCLRG